MPQDSIDARIASITGVTSDAPTQPSSSSGSSTAKPADTTIPVKTPDAGAQGPEAMPSFWDALRGGIGGNPGPAVKYISQFVRDVPKAMWNGATNAVNEMANTGEHIVDAAFDAPNWVAKKAGLNPNFASWYTSEHMKAVGAGPVSPLIPPGLQMYEPQTGLGQHLETLTQLGVGLAAVGKFIEPVEGAMLASDMIKGSKAASIAVKAGMGALKGAGADMATMDAYKGRLSDLLEQIPYIADPVKQYIASNPDDTFAEAKLKQGLEGFMVGAPLEALMGIAGMAKRSRLFTSKTSEDEVRSVFSETGNAMDKAINKINTRYQTEAQPDGTFRVKDTKAPSVLPQDTQTPQSLALTKTEDLGEGNSYNYYDITHPQDGPVGKLTTLTQGADKPPAVRVSTTSIEDAYRGKGLGKTAYKQLADQTLADGKQLWSDGSVTEDAARLYDSLKKQGYTVEKNPDAVLNSEGKWTTPNRQEPVFKVTAGPSKPTTSSVLAAGGPEPDQSQDLYHPHVFETEAQAEAEAAILNVTDLEQQRMNPPGKPFTKEQIDAYKQTVGDLDSPEKFAELLQNGGTDFNFHVIHGEEDAKAQLEILSKIQREGLDEARGGARVSHAETIAIAKSMFPGEDPEAFVGRLTRFYKNSQDGAAHLLAGKSLMILQARRMAQLSAMAKGMPESPVAMSRMISGLEEFYHTVAAVKSIQTNAARTVEIGKVDAATLLDNAAPAATGAVDKSMTVLERQTAAQGAEAVAARKALVAVHGMSYEDLKMLTDRLAVAGGDPDAILAAVASVPRMPKPMTVFGFRGPGKVMEQGTEWLINSLISGPLTMMKVNTAMGLNQIIRPVEMMAAGAMRGSAGAALRQEGWQTLASTYLNAWDSIKLAAKALKTGNPILDASDSFSGAPQYIGGDIGTLARTSSRLHMAANEFWQQMAYRANATAAYLKEAGEKGVTDVEQYVKDKLDASFSGPNRTGRGLNKAALNYARESTFSQDLPAGSYPASAQRFIQEHPVTKVIAPFTLKPANLMYWSWDRTPGINLLHKSFRDDLFAGGDRSALALAKMGTGLSMWTALAGLAYAGRITGKGPIDTDLNKQGQDLQGVPPEYSINFGSEDNPTWLSYKNIEPLAAPVKLATDLTAIIADAVKASGEVSESHTKNIGVATATLLANAFQSETYFTSMTNFLSAVGSNDPAKWQKFIQNETGAMLVPNVLNQFNPDPYVREIRGAMDAALARTPGLSSQVPPRYNVLGEPVMKAPGLANRALNPFTVSWKSNGKLEAAMMALDKAMPMPSPSKNGVDLTSDEFGRTKDGLTPYDRMMQLMGQPKYGGKNVRDDLTELMNDRSWSDLPDSSTDKFKRMADKIAVHRDRAERQMRDEFPALDRYIIQAGQGIRAKKVGGEEAQQRVMAQQQQR